MKTAIFAFLYCYVLMNSAFAQGEVYKLGETGNYCAAVKTDVFKFYMAEQEYDNWCWAACTQMVLNYQGVDVSQTDIVEKVYGGAVNKPANCTVITRGADGWNHNGQTIEAWEETNISAFDFIDALAFKYPVIIGLNMPGQNIGHAYVLTGVYFRYGQNNKKIPYKVILRDPWPPNPDRTELTWNDFTSRINCIVHVTH